MSADLSRLQQLSVPLINGPIKIYYIGDLQIPIVYPPGVINTFYSSIIPKEILLQILDKPDSYSCVIDAIKTGFPINFGELLGDHTHFGGIGKTKIILSKERFYIFNIIKMSFSNRIDDSLVNDLIYSPVEHLLYRCQTEPRVARISNDRYIWIYRIS